MPCTSMSSVELKDAVLVCKLYMLDVSIIWSWQSHIVPPKNKKNLESVFHRIL